MTEAIINFFRDILHNDILTTFVISIIPIIELRGAIPVAISMGIHPMLAFLFAWLGTSMVAPILLLLLKPVLNWMKKFRIFKSLAMGLESIFDGKATKVASKALSSDPKKIERKKLIGVFAFVAVPLPMTGVWTGSAIAVFMGLPFFKSMLAILAGNLIAGVIITLLAFFLSAYMDAILTGFLIIVLIVLLIFIIKLIKKIYDNKAKAKKAAIDGKISENSNEITNQSISLKENNTIQHKVEPKETNIDGQEIESKTVNDDISGDSATGEKIKNNLNKDINEKNIYIAKTKKK